MSAIETLARHPLAVAIGWGLLQSIWQVTVVALVCAVALRFARHAGADVRYAIGCIGLALMLAWPAATVSERLQGDAERSQARSVTEAASADRSAPWSSSRLDIAPDPGSRGARSRNDAANLTRVASYVALVWAAGVLLLAARTIGGWYIAQRLRRRFVAPPPDPWQARFARLVRRLKVAERVALLESGLVDVPTVIGWLKPVVLVPASAFAGLAPHHLEAILAHELAHVRRHDYLANLLQALVETFLFYHPAMWWLSRQARAEREHCCDDLAVTLCGDRIEYARALADLEVVRRSSPALALGADGGSLLRRVSRVLGSPAPHERRTPAWVLAGIVAVGIAGVVLTDGTVRAERSTDAAEPHTTVIEQSPAPAQPPSAPGAPTPPKAPPAAGNRTPAPPAPPAAPSAPAAPAAPAETMVRGEGRMAHSSPTEKWEVRYKGGVELSDDARDIARITPGGYLKISEGGWFSSRSLTLTGTANGIERKFHHGLRERPYDDEAREFLAAMLQKMVRTGFAAPQRVARLLQQGGPNAVLGAIEQIDSDYGRKQYYVELFRQAPLDGPTFARALARAGQQISSDYESAELLIASAKRAIQSPDSRRTFFESAARIDSDYEQRRVLGAALEAGVTGDAGLRELLGTVRAIDSDYEAAELLIAVASRRPLDAPTAPAFFEAASGIGSDYEHRRVLLAVMKQGTADAAVRKHLLQSASAIGSDYERAEFLLQWLNGGGFDAAAGEFLAAAEGISSGYERARVLSAVLAQDRLPASALVATLRVVATISGDYEISQLLRQVVMTHAVAGEVRDAYLAAADRLRDGSEKDQAYAALVRAERQR